MRRRLTAAVTAISGAAAIVSLAAACSTTTSTSGSAGSPGTTTAPAPSGTAGTSGTTTTTTAPGTTPAGTVESWLAGVHPAVAPRSKTSDASLRAPDGRVRTYHVYVPSTLDARSRTGARVPLLVALHGGTGWGTQFERNSGFDGLAESNDFIVAYPDGIGVGTNNAQLRTWNGGGCCGTAARSDVDDVGFIRGLIDTLESRYPIDPAHVYAAGHSNGGILAYRLACQLSDRIVAIGVQSTSLEYTPCTPAQPVSVLHIHGTADRNIPIAGGRGPDGITSYAFHPPLDAATTLAARDGCAATPATALDRGNTDLTVSVWGSCRSATEVAFVKVAGATHGWMGHSAAAPKRVGPPYQRLDSSALIWGFLLAHSRA